MAAENVDLELDGGGDGVSASDHPVRKNISLKLSSKIKAAAPPAVLMPQKRPAPLDESPTSSGPPLGEISTMVDRGPAEPRHRGKPLNWNLKSNLIGEKVVDPMIHCCGACSLPILIYGRMIPCKHVFCLACAKKIGDVKAGDKKCPRCKDPVKQISQSALGTVFLCTAGGKKHGTEGCRRTYLSQRDLDAHVKVRHGPKPAGKAAAPAKVSPSSQTPVSSAPAVPAPSAYQVKPSAPVPQQQTSAPRPMRSSNLITIQIQDDSLTGSSHTPSPQPQSQTSRLPPAMSGPLASLSAPSPRAGMSVPPPIAGGFSVAQQPVPQVTPFSQPPPQQPITVPPSVISVPPPGFNAPPAFPQAPGVPWPASQPPPGLQGPGAQPTPNPGHMPPGFY